MAECTCDTFLKNRVRFTSLRDPDCPEHGDPKPAAKSSEQHTSVPWEAVRSDGPDSEPSGQVKQRRDGGVYNIAIFRNLVDAEFAVRACNSHDELLEIARHHASSRLFMEKACQLLAKGGKS